MTYGYGAAPTERRTCSISSPRRSRQRSHASSDVPVIDDAAWNTGAFLADASDMSMLRAMTAFLDALRALRSRRVTGGRTCIRREGRGCGGNKQEGRDKPRGRNEARQVARPSHARRPSPHGAQAFPFRRTLEARRPEPTKTSTFRPRYHVRSSRITLPLSAPIPSLCRLLLLHWKLERLTARSPHAARSRSV